MIDEEILFLENSNVMLDLIHKDLYGIVEDKSHIFFHDRNCHKLFFIYLHDYISAQTKLLNMSLFDLTIKFCKKYKTNNDFKEIINKGTVLKEFLIKERIYPNVHISPHIVELKTNLLELINFAGNEAKHSYFRLNKLKKKMEKIFKKNGIEIAEDKDYYDHLAYFMEWVVEDKLEYHQTRIVELLGNYFLAINRMLNSDDCKRVRRIRDNSIKSFKSGKYIRPVKPDDLSEIEEFHWKIMRVGGVRENRLTDIIPITSPYLQIRD